MRFGIRTLDELSVRGKTVLCRIDINQPIDRETGTLKSINRIVACVPTVRELADRGARVVLLAHQGSDIEYANFYTTRPHADVLAQLLGRPVQWIDDVCGPAAREKIKALREGEILLLDNVRFVSEEQTLFEKSLRLSHAQQAKTQLVEKLAPLAQLYVCDAFAAAHRDQPSLCGFEQVLPGAMGRLFEKEYCAVSQVMEAAEKPCVFVLGGAKIADAFAMMRTVLERGIADSVLTGGLVANVFLAASGRFTGEGMLAQLQSRGFDALLPEAAELLERFGARICLPQDLARVEDGQRREAALQAFPAQCAPSDIGTQTAARYAETILRAKTVFANGPMGIFEQAETAYGTKTVWEAMAASEGYTVLGGGDSITATEKFGLTDKMDYICTGGGALIRFLSGEELPVVRALRHCAGIAEGD